MIGPAPVTEITNLQFHGLIQFGSALLGSLFLNLLLHILWIEHVLVKIELVG